MTVGEVSNLLPILTKALLKERKEKLFYFTLFIYSVHTCGVSP